MTGRWEAPKIKAGTKSNLPVAIDGIKTMLAKSRTTGRRAENKASARNTDLATTEGTIERIRRHRKCQTRTNRRETDPESVPG